MHSSVLALSVKILFIASFVASYDYSHYKYKYWKKPKWFGGSKKEYKEEECKADYLNPWNHRGKTGPEFWAYSFPMCKGKYQSPIDINSEYVIYDPELEKLKLNNYDIPVKKSILENVGHEVQITPEDDIERGIFIYEDKYILQELHFHWGDSYKKGSEHKLDGIQYALEAHFVHRNEKDEIAVVAILFEEKSYDNPKLDHILKYFPKVKFNDTRFPIKYEMYLESILPENPATFYRYEGSLTTPECDEGVTWSVLKKPNYLGKKQMALFRSLYSAKKSDATPKCKISNNFRPVQPLNDRKVYLSN